MGGELKRILEGQRQLEEQFNQLTLDEDSSGMHQLRDHAHSINATTQSMLVVCPYITVCVNYYGRIFSGQRY